MVFLQLMHLFFVEIFLLPQITLARATDKISMILRLYNMREKPYLLEKSARFLLENYLTAHRMTKRFLNTIPHRYRNISTLPPCLHIPIKCKTSKLRPYYINSTYDGNSKLTRRIIVSTDYLGEKHIGARSGTMLKEC